MRITLKTEEFFISEFIIILESCNYIIFFLIFNILMLYSYFCTKEFKRAAQSGFYIDFFLKNVFEAVVRNVLVYSAQFFCEKYMIEFFTKKFFVNIIYYFNFGAKSSNFDYRTFFIQLITFFFYISSVLLFLIAFML
jgi:hypothetical protein